MNCGECANTLKALDGFSNQVFCTIHHWHNGEREDASRCSYFKKKPKTNADRIRAMTDEELADMLNHAQGDGYLVGIGHRKISAYGNWLDWLKQEAKE